MNARLAGPSKKRCRKRAASRKRRHTRTKRRGVTSLEYVVVISLIFVVCIIAIQQIGLLTGSSLKKSAEETAKTVPK